MTSDSLEYVGFWARVGAALIDTVLVLVVTLPILVAIYGWAYFDGAQTGFAAGIVDFLLSWVAPAVWVAFDPRKQGWHDKLAGTVVIRSRNGGPRRP